MHIVKYLTHFQLSTYVSKTVNKIFSAPNSTDPEQDCDSIHQRHSDYESILTNNHVKAMIDFVKDRIDTYLVSTALLK